MRTSFSAVTLFALSFACQTIAAEVKSGPQVGEKLPSSFHPFNINGPDAGKKSCLVCRAGLNPTAMIFAREPDGNLVELIKKLDKAAVANKQNEMNAFVVFCTDDKELETKLKDVAENAALKECVLATDNIAGPKGYKIDKEAAITVVLYVEREVKANYVFKKGEMQVEDIEKILKDLPNINGK